MTTRCMNSRSLSSSLSASGAVAGVDALLRRAQLGRLDDIALVQHVATSPAQRPRRRPLAHSSPASSLPRAGHVLFRARRRRRRSDVSARSPDVASLRQCAPHAGAQRNHRHSSLATARLFFFVIHYMHFPDCLLLVLSIFRLLLSTFFLFLHFLLVGSVR